MVKITASSSWETIITVIVENRGILTALVVDKNQQKTITRPGLTEERWANQEITGLTHKN